MLWLFLAVSLTFPFAGAAVVTVIAKKDVTDWYQHLKLPAPKPPTWVFGPVWVPLYLLAGVATTVVYATDLDMVAGGVTLGAYLAMMAVNWVTMPRLLNVHGVLRRRFSLLLQTATLLPKPTKCKNVHPRSIINDGIILWLSTLLVIVLYSWSNVWAGLMMTPHLVWTTAAVALCYGEECNNNATDDDDWAMCRVSVSPNNNNGACGGAAQGYSELH